MQVKSSHIGVAARVSVSLSFLCPRSAGSARGRACGGEAASSPWAGGGTCPVVALARDVDGLSEIVTRKALIFVRMLFEFLPFRVF